MLINLITHYFGYRFGSASVLIMSIWFYSFNHCKRKVLRSRNYSFLPLTAINNTLKMVIIFYNMALNNDVF